MRLSVIKKALLWITVIALIFGLAAMLNSTMKNTFEFNPDEGTNIIKAELLLKQFSLYKQIWSDQPPLFTTILALWFRIFEPSVYSGRILVLFFSLLFIWGFYRNIRIKTDPLTAFTACIFLVFSAQFLQLSISVMIGIPSLALAMLSVYCQALYNKSQAKYLLILSGAFMALSLEIKFFSALLIPLILLEIAIGQSKDKKLRQPFLDMLIWLIAASVLYCSITLLFFWPDLNLFAEQLFKPHLAEISIPQADFSVIFKSLFQDYDIALLTILSLAINFRVKTNMRILLPGLWLGLALLILIILRPIWSHYYMLISIPMCWLASVVFVELCRKARVQKNKTLSYYLTFTLIILIAARMPYKFIAAWSIFNHPGVGEENRILDLISKFKEDDKWIFTDLPIYAFKTGLLVPPETAVLTLKRLPTAKTVAFVLKKYKPGLILLGRFKDYSPEMIYQIQKDYRKEMEIFIRRPVTHTVCLWYPISTFFPSGMQLSVGKRLNGSRQNFRIPVVKRISYFYPQKITLYVLKTDAG